MGRPPSKGVTLHARTLPLLASKSLPILRRRCNIHPLFQRNIHVRCPQNILGNFYKCFTTVYLRPHFNLETGNCLLIRGGSGCIVRIEQAACTLKRMRSARQLKQPQPYYGAFLTSGLSTELLCHVLHSFLTLFT